MDFNDDKFEDKEDKEDEGYKKEILLENLKD